MTKIDAQLQTLFNELENIDDGDKPTFRAWFANICTAIAEQTDTPAQQQQLLANLCQAFVTKTQKKNQERLGVVYTPVEVVDFILHSVDDILHQEFGKGLSDDDVQILEPFAGIGIFVTRLLQSGLIDEAALERKYESEIHANEIMPLPFMIAQANIEQVYESLTGEHKEFHNIQLTDTFKS